MADILLCDIADRVAVLTLNRPEARNALSSALLRELPAAMRAADENDDVDVVILTGADPAFCAGLDLKELGSTGDNLRGSGNETAGTGNPWPAMTKPVIGAINGVAVTGGFELALQCDLLIASERARFADTHTRVGVMPGWGLAVLLPQAIGLRRAKEMSMTGNFMGADEAFHFGLVNRVVPHGELLPAARALAADIVSNDQPGVRTLLDEYKQVARTTVEDGLRIEREVSRGWMRSRGGFDPAEVERRRAGIVSRGRSQQ
jgi:enoyl-CoA hydratase